MTPTASDQCMFVNVAMTSALPGMQTRAKLQATRAEKATGTHQRDESTSAHDPSVTISATIE